MARNPKPKDGAGTTPAIRNELGRFVPGVSGNPTGRPPISKEIRNLAQADSPEAYRKVKAIMVNDDHKHQLAAAVAILKMAGVAMNAEERPADPDAPSPSAPVTDDQIRDVIGVH